MCIDMDRFYVHGDIELFAFDLGYVLLWRTWRDWNAGISW